MLTKSKHTGHTTDGRRRCYFGGGIVEGMLLGAAVGGGTSLATGGDPLKGALLGGLTGGIGGGITGGLPGAGAGAGAGAGSGAGAAASGAAAASVPAATSAGISALPGAASLTGLPASFAPAAASAAPAAAPMAAGQAAANMATRPLTSMIDDAARLAAPTAAPAAPSALSQLPSFAPNTVPGVMGQGIQTAMQNAPAAPASVIDDLKEWWGGLSPKEKLMYGVGGSLAGSMLMESVRGREAMQDEEEYKGPLSKFRYDPGRFVPTLPYADGGITSLGGVNIAVGGDPRRNIPPISQDNPSMAGWQSRSQPVSFMNNGGIASLGSYSDGGRLLKGPGDGVSDSIPATLGRKQPARLADGEFVVPARIVSELGNGSTDAGARQLYAMMDRVQSRRRKTVGKNRVAVDSKARKMLPA